MKSPRNRWGVVLACAPSLMAVGGQSASAQTHTFAADSAQERTVITGADEAATNHRLFAGENVVECDHSLLEGTMSGNDTSAITLRPVYFGTDEEEQVDDCVAAGNEAAVKVNDCAYVLRNETSGNHAALDIECAEGDNIEVALIGLGTTLLIEAQSGLSGVHYTNISKHRETGKSALTVDATVEGIDTACEGFFCFLFETGEGTGTYEGRSVLTGYDEAETCIPDPPTTPDYDDDEGEVVNLGIE